MCAWCTSFHHIPVPRENPTCPRWDSSIPWDNPNSPKWNSGIPWDNPNSPRWDSGIRKDNPIYRWDSAIE